MKRLIKYVRGKIYLKLTLEATSLALIKWWVDVSCAVHPGFSSLPGAVISLREGVVTSMSWKQCINTKISAKAEVVRVDDAATQVL